MVRGLLGIAVVSMLLATSGARAQGAEDVSPVSLTIEGGYRYIHDSLDHLDADDAKINGAFEGGLVLHIGDENRGFYGGGRFDLYFPDGRPGTSYGAEARVGFFHHVEHFDSGLRTYSSDNVRCWNALGVCRVSSYSETRRVAPPRWWRSIEYYWLGYRLVGGVPERSTSRGGVTNETMHAITAGIGVTTPGRGAARGRFEVDVQRFLNGVAGQNPWALRMRGGFTAGPVYADLMVLFDDVVGGELALGAGILLRTH